MGDDVTQERRFPCAKEADNDDEWNFFSGHVKSGDRNVPAMGGLASCYLIFPPTTAHAVAGSSSDFFLRSWNHASQMQIS